MRNVSKVSPVPAILVKDQLWQTGARMVKIGHVGKLLVHHRTVDPVLKRTSRESITAIKTLQQFLIENSAVLVEKS